MTVEPDMTRLQELLSQLETDLLYGDYSQAHEHLDNLFQLAGMEISDSRESLLAEYRYLRKTHYWEQSRVTELQDILTRENGNVNNDPIEAFLHARTEEDLHSAQARLASIEGRINEIKQRFGDESPGIDLLLPSQSPLPYQVTL